MLEGGASLDQSKTKIVAIAVAVGFGLFVALLAAGVSIARYERLPTGPAPPTEEHVEVIMRESFDIGAGAYESRQFEAPVHAISPIVRGSFDLNGTSDDSINVMILNETGFLKWQNDRNAPQSFYTREDVIAAELEANIPSGQTLYLVFDNTSPSNRAKSVNASIELSYLK